MEKVFVRKSLCQLSQDKRPIAQPIDSQLENSKCMYFHSYSGHRPDPSIIHFSTCLEIPGTKEHY